MNPIKKIKTDGGYVSIFRSLGFIGDSLSSGEHESHDENGNGYHDYYDLSWGQFIARKCGLKGINFSRGGLTAKSFFEWINLSGISPFVEENKCQGYVIALGVNDINHLSDNYDSFGSFDDIDWENEDNNKNTYIGWYVKIIQKLRKLEPKCRIFVMTTPKESPESKLKKENFDKIRDFLLELPKYFEFLYVLNLRDNAPIYDKKFAKKYFCGGHMSAMGYKFTADMVMTYMSYYIEKYPSDFTQVGFIGKGGIHNDKEKW